MKSLAALATIALLCVGQARAEPHLVLRCQLKVSIVDYDVITREPTVKVFTEDAETLVFNPDRPEFAIQVKGLEFDDILSASAEGSQGAGTAASWRIDVVHGNKTLGGKKSIALNRRTGRLDYKSEIYVSNDVGKTSDATGTCDKVDVRKNKF